MSILSSFACSESWKVVPASDEIKARIGLADLNTIKQGQKRHWPICVYEKDSHKLTRKPAGKVCSQTGLYGILNYDDVLTRALIRFNIEVNNPDTDLEIRDFREFMHFGEKPLDPDLIERLRIGEIDNEFGALLPLLRNNQQLNQEQILVILRFVAFARFRTPTWRRVYFPELYARRLALFKQALMFLNESVRKFENQWGINIDTLNKAIDDHLYHIAMVEYSSKQFNPLQAFLEPKILVLHSKESLSFITCDNPGRPYHPDYLRMMYSDPLPGFADQKSQIVYALDPKRCLMISSNSVYPNFSYRDVKANEVRAINTALAIMADKEIIFPEPTTSVFENWLRLDELRPIRRP